MGCCGNSKFIKYIWIFIGLLLLAALIFSLISCGETEKVKQVKTTGETMDNGILYYTCGMHPSVRVSPEEYNKGNVNCPICNMKLTPVYKEESQSVPQKSSEDRKILFYRNPMNPSITSKVPAKDEMGMNYIPVYEESSDAYVDESGNTIGRVTVNADQTRLAGVKTEQVRRRRLYKTIRTVGKVAYDPQLAIAQEEFISSLEALDKIKMSEISEIKERAVSLVESAKRKLRLLGLSKEQIKELEMTRTVQSNLILPEKKMWVYGDVYEYELGWVEEGGKVEVMTAGLPGEKFTGIISSVNPVLDPKTRSVKIRAEVDNPTLKLKPDMYVDVVIMSMYTSPSGERMVLAIPKDAVLDTGTRKIVWVDKGNGEYEAREVQIGPETNTTIDGRKLRAYPLLEGLNEGEMVVTRANFLIDSQSQITGVAASAYGGALDTEGEAGAPSIHQH
jgi:Cu(I)/Ag(I) efflux system membrane fusion protein